MAGSTGSRVTMRTCPGSNAIKYVFYGVCFIFTIGMVCFGRFGFPFYPHHDYFVSGPPCESYIIYDGLYGFESCFQHVLEDIKGVEGSPIGGVFVGCTGVQQATAMFLQVFPKRVKCRFASSAGKLNALCSNLESNECCYHAFMSSVFEPR